MVADAATAGAVRNLTDDFLPTFSDTAIDDQRVGHGGPHPYWSAGGKGIFSQAAGRGSTLVYAVPAPRGGTPPPLRRARPCLPPHRGPRPPPPPPAPPPPTRP